MSESAELTVLCADYDITEASGKVSRAEYDIVKLLSLMVADMYLQPIIGGMR